MAKTTSLNPYTGEELKSYKNHTKKEVSEIIDKADKRFYSWRETSFSERKKLMLAAASDLKKKQKGICRNDDFGNGKAHYTSHRRS